MPFSVKTPDASPGFLLWRLTCEWQREQRQALAKIGLTHPQFVVLASLLWLTIYENHPITQRHLSEHTKIDKMTMSTLVTTLERKKLIKRVDHHLDSRAYSLTLTNKGHEYAVKAIPIVEGIDKQFFKREAESLNKLFKAL